MAIEDYYRELQLRRTTQTVDEYGDTLTTTSEPIPFLGYVGKPQSAVVVQAAQRGVNITGRLYTSLKTDVRPFDVVTEPDTGRTWQVTSEPRDVANRGHHVEADLTEWRGGV